VTAEILVAFLLNIQVPLQKIISRRWHSS